MTARDIAILDLLHHGYHPPAPNCPEYERLIQLWTARYRVRLACAARMFAAVDAIQVEESCPPSP